MTEAEWASPDKNCLKEGWVEVDLGNLLRARVPVYSLKQQAAPFRHHSLSRAGAGLVPG
jgi:hypothetical protein